MGGKGGGGEAAEARKDEQERQSRIREGTNRINAIFDGGARGVNALGKDAEYDPGATYYNADGSVWAPTDAQAGGAPSLGNMFGGSRSTTADPQAQFAKLLEAGALFSGRTEGGGFDDDFFSGRRQAYLDYASPQLEDQYAQAQKDLTFALTRGGLLDSSVRGDKVAELQKKYDLNKQQIADQAIASETDARNAVESGRADLIGMLNATGDAQGAANSAIARASALSQPAAYSPLTSLFADFTAGLGTQAALERANAYAGTGVGQSQIGRYNTGLFPANPNAIRYT